MATLNTKQTFAMETMVVQYDGYCGVAGSAGVITAQGLPGATVSRTGVATYDVTFPQAFAPASDGTAAQVKGLVVTPALPNVDAAYVAVLKSVSLTTAKKFTFKLVNGSGTPTELPANSGFCISFAIKNSALNYGK